MKLFVGRHGEAGMAPRDDDRCLTARGRADCSDIYSQCRDSINDPGTMVVVSPLVRAQETAAIALSELRLAHQNAITSPLLRPEGDVSGLARWLDQLDADSVLVVGHQPLLGNFLAWLCDNPAMVYEVATASLHALDVLGFSRGGASLCWSRKPF